MCAFASNVRVCFCSQKCSNLLVVLSMQPRASPVTFCLFMLHSHKRCACDVSRNVKSTVNFRHASVTLTLHRVFPHKLNVESGEHGQMGSRINKVTWARTANRNGWKLNVNTTFQADVWCVGVTAAACRGRKFCPLFHPKSDNTPTDNIHLMHVTVATSPREEAHTTNL